MASGNSLNIFSSLHNIAPNASYASIDFRNNHPLLDFDDTDIESTMFTSVMPGHYDGGGVTAYLHFSCASAVSSATETFDWDLAWERIGDEVQDINSDGFAAVQSSANNEAPAVSGHVKVITIPFTDGAQMDTVGSGESYRVKLTRRSDNDDGLGDAEFHFLELRES